MKNEVFRTFGIGRFSTVRELTPVWVKSGSGGEMGQVRPNSGTDLFGTVGSHCKRNPPFLQLLRYKNGGYSGRSVGIRTRGLLDPKSSYGENPIILCPLYAELYRTQRILNKYVQTVHMLISFSGSAFGSGKIGTPPKSAFTELLCRISPKPSVPYLYRRFRGMQPFLSAVTYSHGSTQM